MSQNNTTVAPTQLFSPNFPKKLFWSGVAGAGTAIVGVSAAYNWQFGFASGSAGLNQYLTGLAYVSADVIKAAAVIGFGYAITQRKKRMAIGAGLLAAVGISWSMLSAASVLSEGRAQSYQDRLVAMPAYQKLVKERTKLKARKVVLETGELPASIESRIRSLKATPGANGCNHIDGPISRSVCSGVNNLQIKLAQAKREQFKLAEINSRLLEINSELIRVKSQADNQSAYIARFSAIALDLKLSRDEITIYNDTLRAVGLELLSLIALSLAAFGWRSVQPQRPTVEPVPEIDIVNSFKPKKEGEHTLDDTIAALHSLGYNTHQTSRALGELGHKKGVSQPTIHRRYKEMAQA